MRLLVTGATGLLGPHLLEHLASVGEVVGVARSGADEVCDLTDVAATARLLARVRPDVVVHAAGLTDVDRCEREPEAATAQNELAAASLVSAADASTLLVGVSTDQVYGSAGAPHAEADVAPVNVYGRTKLAGERALATHPAHLVLRTNMFGPSRTPGRASLSDFVVDALTTGQPVTFFTDVLFSPLHLATLSELVGRCVRAGLSGTFNAGSRQGRSKHDFGMAIAAHRGLPTDGVTAGRSTDLPGRAPRPLDLRLDVRALEAAIGIVMPLLDDEIKLL